MVLLQLVAGFSAQNNKDFIKLDQTTNALPTDSIEGVIYLLKLQLVLKFRVDKVTVAAGSDPAVLHVTYTDNGSGDGTYCRYCCNSWP